MTILTDRIAIISGCGKGIGRATALAAAAAGATVVGIDIDPREGERTIAEANAISPGSVFHLADISDGRSVQDCIGKIISRFGRVDILVNNAGVTKPTDFFDVTVEDIDWILGVNVRGTLAMMQAVARPMRDAGYGRIVNVASIAGKGYRKTSNVAYAASKGAIIAITRVAAARLGSHGICVNAVCPGITGTEMMMSWLDKRARDSGRPRDELGAELVEETSLRRMNAPADVADAILFLASDQARNITGQSVNVDSGLMWD